MSTKEQEKEKLEKIIKDGIIILNEVNWGSTIYDETNAIVTRARLKLLKLESEELLK